MNELRIPFTQRIHQLLRSERQELYRVATVILLLCVGLKMETAAATDALSLLKRATATLYTNPKEAASLASRALQLCDMSHPDSVCREATIVYGDAEQLLGNFDLSIRILYDAEHMTDSTDRHTLARIQLLQGRVFSKLGDYARSNELNDRATATFKSLGDSTYVAKCYTQRGVTLLNCEEPKLAELFFRKSLDINRKIKNFEAIAHNLNNMCLYPG
ncbi:MAG: LuxR family transcriptional regulator, partial [Muribaculaceae bacterium]|nr:LuxR family transcriptional regulator [Muribaculaceae bacterium]